MILCKNCKNCVVKRVGYVSHRAYCKALPKKRRGIDITKKIVNPNCPLKINKQ